MIKNKLSNKNNTMNINMEKIRRDSLLRAYVMMHVPTVSGRMGQLGCVSRTKHNPKKRGILHFFMSKGYSVEDLVYMATVISQVGPGYTLEDDLSVSDSDGKTVFDEAVERKCFTEFQENIKYYRED
jgi:hypothetical protein